MRPLQLCDVKFQPINTQDVLRGAYARESVQVCKSVQDKAGTPDDIKEVKATLCFRKFVSHHVEPLQQLTCLMDRVIKQDDFHEMCGIR
ncbi:hypothetical protein Q8A67_016277 [Cirrhinus molitorella]|nr:hypothetical protein Q8A67_016277 [Cirrhinus molitorella]